MISAKKLIPEREDQPTEYVQQEIEIKSTRFQNIVKLVIMMLLTYVIIFM